MKKSSDFFFRKKNKKTKFFYNEFELILIISKNKIKTNMIISQIKIIYERTRDNT